MKLTWTDILIAAIIAAVVQTIIQTSMMGYVSGGACGLLYLFYRDGGKFPKNILKFNRGVKNAEV